MTPFANAARSGLVFWPVHSTVAGSVLGNGRREFAGDARRFAGA